LEVTEVPGSQKRSNGGNGENEEFKIVFLSVSFVFSVAPFLRSVTLIYLLRLEAPPKPANPRTPEPPNPGTAESEI